MQVVNHLNDFTLSLSPCCRNWVFLWTTWTSDILIPRPPLMKNLIPPQLTWTSGLARYFTSPSRIALYHGELGFESFNGPDQFELQSWGSYFDSYFEKCFYLHPSSAHINMFALDLNAEVFILLARRFKIDRLHNYYDAMNYLISWN